jgi:hypothetical protein
VVPSRRVAVCFEVTPKQAVASALDWPGWCRAGRDEVSRWRRWLTTPGSSRRWPHTPGQLPGHGRL